MICRMIWSFEPDWCIYGSTSRVLTRFHDYDKTEKWLGTILSHKYIEVLRCIKKFILSIRLAAHRTSILKLNLGYA